MSTIRKGDLRPDPLNRAGRDGAAATCGLLLLPLITLSRIVGRVHVGNSGRAKSVEFDNGILCEPSVVLHTFSCLREAAGFKSSPFRFIDRAAHSYVERPGEDGAFSSFGWVFGEGLCNEPVL